MSRVAKWRRGPGDPEMARGWLFRGERSREGSPPPDRRRLLLIGGFLVGYVLALALLALAVPKGWSYAPVLNVACPVFGFFLNRKPKRTPIEERPELEEPFPVELTIRAPNTLMTGSDRGQLIFCDGWLLFEGRRTEFAVTRGEADGRLESRSVSLQLEDGRTACLSLPEGAETESLKQAYDLWHATTPPDGEAILPPVEIHPEVWATRWMLCLLGSAFFVVPAGAGIALGLWPIAVPAGLGIVACLVSAGLYARRLRQEISRVLPNVVSASLEPREAQTASIQ